MNGVAWKNLSSWPEFIEVSISLFCRTKRLLADLAVGYDVIRITHIDFVDLRLGDELVNFDCALTLDGNRLKFFGVELDVFALSDFVALDDVGLLDLIAGLGVHFSVADAIARFFIELMETDFFSL
jgi:hypothetical protein